MFRPESPLSKATAPDPQGIETKASPSARPVKTKYMNFAEALQAMIERAEARRVVGENSETHLAH
jgi:hypothetical protein